MNDEFYIGYEPDMPAQLALRIRRIARGLVALALVITVLGVLYLGIFPGRVINALQTRIESQVMTKR